MSKEEFCATEQLCGTAKINLFSVHLSTYKDERILACKELNKIIDKIDDDEIVIVGGDFNVGVTRLGSGRYTFEKQDEYEEYKILSQKLKKLPNTEDTWFSKLGQGCIDTMFYSDKVELLTYKTVDVENRSDHKAIYAEFNIQYRCINNRVITINNMKGFDTKWIRKQK